jgi:amino acid transporter
VIIRGLSREEPSGAGGLSVVLVYFAVNVSSIRAFRTKFRGEFRLWRHLLVPATATACFLFPLWGYFTRAAGRSWTCCAEMPLAGANDGLFPERFRRMSSKQVPSFGIIASTVLASAAMIINYLGSSGATVFTTLVLMTGITAAIPYVFSAPAQLKWRWIDHKTLETPRFVRDMIVAVLALVFSIWFIWYSRNTGHSFWVYWAPFFLAGGALLLGIPVYLAQRRHLTPLAPVLAYR